MKPHVKPGGAKPQGEPFCDRPKTDWVWAWTLADCLNHFDGVPRLVHVLDTTTTVAAVWHHLTFEMKAKLDNEFAMYDLRTGRI
jgi:hypothetical protein